MKKAFTLAETLITLTIVGIIAILMITNMIKNSPDEKAMMYKKAFATVSQAVWAVSNDPNLYPDPNEMFTDKNIKNVGNNIGEYFCTNIANALNTTGGISCATPHDGTFGTNSTEFTLANGISFSGFNQEFSNEDSNDLTPFTITICADVNGTKGPNIGCKSGDDLNDSQRDRFKIRIDRWGKVTTGDGTDWAKENEILETTGVITK